MYCTLSDVIFLFDHVGAIMARWDSTNSLLASFASLNPASRVLGAELLPANCLPPCHGIFIQVAAAAEEAKKREEQEATAKVMVVQLQRCVLIL